MNNRKIVKNHNEPLSGRAKALLQTDSILRLIIPT